MYTASFYDNSLHANVFCIVNVFQKTLTGKRYNESNYPICRNFGGKEGDFRRGHISGILWYINLIQLPVSTLAQLLSVIFPSQSPEWSNPT